MPETRVHQGYNVKRFRESLGISQEAIALTLDMTQQGISKLEKRESIEDNVLDRIAEFMQVPADSLKNMPQDGNITNVISNFTENKGTVTNMIENQSNTYHYPKDLEQKVEELEKNMSAISSTLEKLMELISKNNS